MVFGVRFCGSKSGGELEIVVKENGLKFEQDTFLHLREAERWVSGTKNN